MTIDSSLAVPSGTVLDTDICVIGAGAAGITIGRRLERSRHRVLILEAGGFERDLETEHASFSIDVLGNPQPNPEPSRGRLLGGSTNLWFGRIARLDPIDFEKRRWIPSSGWPLTGDDLEPWLVAAADLLRVANFEAIALSAWPPNPTIDAFSAGQETDLGVFLWADDDAMYMGRYHRGLLQSSESVHLMTDATVTDLVPDASNAGIGELAVCGSGGNRFTVKARAVVLAAGGLENPRLLLASTSPSGRGVGNNHDVVGRYYMDHPRGEGLARVSLVGLAPSQLDALRLLGERTRSEYGRVQMRVKFSDGYQRRHELLNHAMHAHFVTGAHGTDGYRSAKRLLNQMRSRPISSRQVARDVLQVVKSAPSLISLGVRKVVDRPRATSLVLIDQMEQAPDPESRVTVDHRQRDRFGLPKLQLDWRIGESTYRSQRVMHETMKLVLKRIGITGFFSEVLEHDTEPELWDMKHPSGTTRMSTSPRTGVVDRSCRVHGLSNLYIVGSSVFPTVGHANPTLTVVALAARLADELEVSLPL
jgi:choline dehydrogenase-like flavoprotein